MKPALWHGRTWRESRRGWVVLLLLVSCSRAESAGPFEDGLRLYEAGRRAEAIPYFDRAIAADPKQKEAWLYRGRAYGETKNDDEAFHSYEQALRLDPCYAEAFFQRGRTAPISGNGAPSGRSASIPAQFVATRRSPSTICTARACTINRSRRTC
jgi:tetratricopeptide (TPR) repeat protein